ncbi:protein kinase [Candidatus Riflebacteria bacterium]
MNISQPCLLHTIYLNSSQIIHIQKLIEELKIKFEFRSIAPLNPSTITPEKLENPSKLFPIGTYSGQNILLNVGVIHNKSVFNFLFSSQNISDLEEARDFWIEKWEFMNGVCEELRKTVLGNYLGECVSFIGFGEDDFALIEGIKEVLDCEKSFTCELPTGTLAEFFAEGESSHLFVVAAKNPKKALTIQTILRSLPGIFCYVLEMEDTLKKIEELSPQADLLKKDLKSLISKMSGQTGDKGFDIVLTKDLIIGLKELNEVSAALNTIEGEIKNRMTIVNSNINRFFKQDADKNPLLKNHFANFKKNHQLLEEKTPALKTLLKNGYNAIKPIFKRKELHGPEILIHTLLKALQAGALPDEDKLALGELTSMFSVEQDNLMDLITIAKTISSDNEHFPLSELEQSSEFKENVKNTFLSKAIYDRHKEVKALLASTFSFNEDELKEIFAKLLENAEKAGERKSADVVSFKEPEVASTPAGSDFMTIAPSSAPAPATAAPDSDFRTIPPSSSMAETVDFDEADDDDIPLLGATRAKPEEKKADVEPVKVAAPAPPPPARKSKPPPPPGKGGGPDADGYFGSGVFTITPDYFLNLAKEELKKARYDGAKDLLKRACMLDSNHAESKLYLGISYLKLGEIDKGLGNIEAVINDENAGNEARFFMGYGKLILKDAKAADNFFKDCDISQIEIDYLADVVHLFNEAGKPNRAEFICEQVLTPEKLIECFPDRYKDIKVLGAGGMGVVYRGHDTTLNIPIALKLIRPEWAKDKELVENMLLEAQLMAKVGKHPNIVSIYDIQWKGIPYIMMEYIKGEDLREYINNNKQISHDRILHIAKQAFEGLAFVHENDPPIIHRDIKPENLMLDEKLDVHIMDLGLAEFGAKSEDTPNVVGTPAYMSPEQWSGASGLDGRTDIYSVGIIVYEMITGTLPFMNSFFRKIVSEADSPKSINDKVPEDWENFIVKCIKKNPDERYTTAHDALEALKQLKPFDT